MLDSRLFHFVKKEFQQLRRDRRMFFVAMLAPIIQLIALGYVASTDIKHVPTAYYDEDRSAYSRNYLESFTNSGYFDLKFKVNRQQEITSLLDSGRAKLGIHIPADFGQKIARGETAQALAVIDGSNSSTAGIIRGYAEQITIKQALPQLALFDLKTRVWYNSELKSRNYMVPAIFAQLLMIVSLTLTSASIVKEKERGTIEMLSVTPLRPWELIVGKLLPFTLIAVADICLVFLVATLWFHVPMRGSFWLLLLLSGTFLMSGLGLGLFISTAARTQRQALMATNLVMQPTFILSGFIFPIANMPWAIQALTYFIPLRYFLAIVRDIFLKGSGLIYLWPNVWPLAVFGVLILTMSILRFKKKLE